MEGEEVLFLPLQAYTKDVPTILAAYNKPCELHQGAPDPREVLPPTRHVEWVWRTRKPQQIGVARPLCELVEVPEMAAGRRLSTLSTRWRLQRRLELEEAELRLDWARSVENCRKAQGSGRGSGKRAKAIGGYHTGASQGSRAKGRNQARRRISAFGRDKKIAELAGKVLDILGVRATQTGRRRVVLQEEDGPIVCVWATKGLERILGNQAEAFAAQTNQYGRLLQWLPNRESKLQIHVQEPKTFWNNEGTRIAWNPISILATPKAEDLQELHRLLEEKENRRTVLEAEGMEEPPRPRFWPAPPPNKHCKKALEMPEGEYLVARFAETTFRGAPGTILFLATMGEDGHQNTPLQRLFQSEHQLFSCFASSLRKPRYS